MIRIIKEAKEDYDKLKAVLLASEDEFFGKYATEEDANDAIEDFKKYKDYFPPEKKDLYYWVKLAKIDKDVLDALEDECQNAQREIREKKAYKEFCKLYPSNLVKKLKQHRDEVKELYPRKGYYRYSFWVEEYKYTDGECVVELRKILRKFGLTPEEKEEVQRGSQKMATVGGFDIYKITNYTAAEYYGQNTGWCICGNYPGHENRGELHFNDYLESGIDHYYFLIRYFNTADEEDYCIRISNEGKNYEVWCGSGGEDSICSTLGISDQGTKDAIVYALKLDGIVDTVLMSEKSTEEFILDAIKDNEDNTNILYEHLGYFANKCLKIVVSYYENDKRAFDNIFHDYLFQRSKQWNNREFSDEEIEEKVQDALNMLEPTRNDDEVWFFLARMLETFQNDFGEITGTKRFFEACRISKEDIVHQMVELGVAGSLARSLSQR